MDLKFGVVLLGDPVPELELDLLLMEGISVQELFIAFQADRTPIRSIRVVSRVRSLFIETIATVCLCTKLAEL